MSFATFCSGNFHQLENCLRSNYGYKFLRFQFGLPLIKTVKSRPCNLRLLTTKVEGRNQSSQSSEPYNLNLNLHDKSTKKAELHELKAVPCYNLQQTSEKKVYDCPAVVIVIDVETTGLRRDERIIEIALRDLSGGKNSTFQTLVNPEKVITNAYIHRIRTDMVNRPGVPRFKELLPILLQYIRNRQIDEKPLLFVAHNGRRFDVHIIINEFRRCGMEVPEDWLFLDTYILAKKLVKPDGSKLESHTLDGLRKFYGIPLVGPAHRAMQDVHTLSYVLQKMTFDLKLTIPELIRVAFRASDLTKDKAAP